MKSILIVLFLFLSNTAVAGFNCAILSRGPAKVAHGGTDKTTPLRLEDCEGAKVLSNDVTVCFLNRRGKRFCHPVKAGRTISAASLPTGSASPGLLLTLWDMLKGDPDTVPAVVRGNTPAGFPFNDVLAADGSLRFDFARAGLRTVERFELLEGGLATAAVAGLKITGSAATVSIEKLHRGSRYLWVANADGQERHGMFRLASAEEVARMRHALHLAEQGGSDPLSRAVLRAETLSEAGYKYDAGEVLRRAGVEIAE